MQVCNTCEDFDKCRLRDEELFDLCHRFIANKELTKSQSSEPKMASLNIDYEKLRQYFGFSEFRQPQKDIIIEVLNGKNVLVLMPTGGGKSLCYQYPSLLFDGITVVVSPLISLMKNQVDNLKSNGIAAEYINSSLNDHEIRSIKSELFKNRIKLLYVAPETLTKPSFLDFLKSLKISLFAIDEAHCISEWGHDFRPEYRHLNIIRDTFQDVPIIALTATAISKVQKDIIIQLKLKDCKKYITSFNRKNLFYSVIQKDGETVSSPN